MVQDFSECVRCIAHIDYNRAQPEIEVVMPIRRPYPKETDWIAIASADRTRKLLEERHWSVTDLAKRIEMKRWDLTKYLDPKKYRYRGWNAGLRQKIASAFGLLEPDFLGDMLQRPKTNVADVLSDTTGIWDPATDSAELVLGEFGQHEEMARDGIGFFRIPPCTILLPDMSLRIAKNKFGLYGPLGERIVSFWQSVEAHYRKEYEQCGGVYGDFELKTILFECDVGEMIRGDGQYVGCHYHAEEWLTRLRDTHVKGMNYKLGIVDESTIPADISIDLLGADSLLLVGNTLSVRRELGSLKLIPCTSGPRLQRDQEILRTLARDYADFSRAGMIRTIEKLLKAAQLARRRQCQGSPSAVTKRDGTKPSLKKPNKER